ncbi:PTS fructose transporter subunit IIB, partial [Xanthomonas vasicola]
MSSSIVVIAAGERSTEAVLAAEALRRAATAAGRSVTIEIRSDQGVLGALPSELVSGVAQVLVVGDADADSARFGDAQLVRLSLGAVLDNPAAALSQLAAPAAASASTGAGGAGTGSKRIVAITSCPTGIAHTFMAAEGLQQAAKKLGYQMRVETQGSVGAQDALTDDEIRAADLVIIAADREVDLARFGGKRVFKSGTKPAINDGPALINKALADASV